MPTVLNVGLDPRAVADPSSPSEAFPAVTPEQVRAGLDQAASALAELGLDLDTCLLDRSENAHEMLRAHLQDHQPEIILFGGGVRLEASMTPLFEKLVNIARTESPGSVLCFNTGPNTIVETVERWWPLPTDAEQR